MPVICTVITIYRDVLLYPHVTYNLHMFLFVCWLLFYSCWRHWRVLKHSVVDTKTYTVKSGDNNMNTMGCRNISLIKFYKFLVMHLELVMGTDFWPFMFWLFIFINKKNIVQFYQLLQFTPVDFMNWNINCTAYKRWYF